MWSRMKSRSWPPLILMDGAWFATQEMVQVWRNWTAAAVQCKSTVGSCDWRYPVSKLVVEWAETINNRGYISVLQLYEGEQVVVSLRCFLVEDDLLPDELWRAWGRSDNSYLDEMMDTVNILWRCWFQSQLDQYCTTVGLQLIEVFQISKMELGVSRKEILMKLILIQDVGSLGNYNNPTQPGLLLGVVLFIFVID